MAEAIASALRVVVPLKAMCSSICEMPCSAWVSLREPALTQMPSEALSRCGMSSVRTVMPFSSLVLLTLTDTPLRQRRGSSRDRRASRAGAGQDVGLHLALVVAKDIVALG